MITDVQQAFDRQMQIAFGRAVNERVLNKPVHVILHHRRKNAEIFAQPLQARRQNRLVNHPNPPV